MTAIKTTDVARAESNPHPPSALIVAATRDGTVLPVIDVTDPRFAVPDIPTACASFSTPHMKRSAAIGAFRNLSCDGW